MTTTVKFVSTIDSKLSQLGIENGQLIFATDTRTIYLDLNGVRTEYNQIVVLFNENQRLSLLSPIEGLFYFVKETNVLWRYDGNYQWVQLTSPPKENIILKQNGDVAIFENGNSGTVRRSRYDLSIKYMYRSI